MSGEYVERCIEAQEALRAVLELTEPGTGWKLHAAYGELKATIAELSGPALPPRDSEAGRRHRMLEYRRRALQKAAMRATAGEQRERMLLDGLGDETLTIRALTARLRDKHPDLGVTPEIVRGCANDLVTVGELHREKLQEDNRMVWHYRRNTKLSGPIADLDHQFTREGG
jgi:hypothetical protein